MSDTYDLRMGEIEGHLEAMFKGVKGGMWSSPHVDLPMGTINDLAGNDLGDAVKDRITELIVDPDISDQARHYINEVAEKYFG